MNKIERITDKTLIKEIEQKTGQSIGTIYQDPYIKLVKDAVCFPNGNTGTYIRLMDPEKTHRGSVILPIVKETGEVVLLRHWRYAPQEWAIEAPRGFGKIDMNSQSNAISELREETSLTVNTLIPMGSVQPDNGLFDKEVDIYAAMIDSIDLKPSCHDQIEMIEEFLICSKAELCAMIQENVIKDAFTLSAISKAMMFGFL